MSHGDDNGGDSPPKIAYIGILSLIAIWLVMGYSVHGGNDEERNIVFITAVILAFRMFNAPFLLIWQRVRHHPAELAWKSWDMRTMLRRSALIIAPFNFIGQLLWYISLPLMAVDMNTNLYNVSAVFVFILSVIFLKERATVSKILAVSLCCLGIMLLAINAEANRSAEEEYPDQGLGILCCIASAFLYACYEVVAPPLIDKAVLERSEDLLSGESDDSISEKEVELFTSVIYIVLAGVVGCIAFVPLVLLAHITGIESLSTLSGSDVEVAVVVGILDCFYNGLLYAILGLSSPLFVSVGLVLTFPMSMLIDMMFEAEHVDLLTLTGHSLIILGFIELTLHPLAKCWKKNTDDEYDPCDDDESALDDEEDAAGLAAPLDSE